MRLSMKALRCSVTLALCWQAVTCAYGQDVENLEIFNISKAVQQNIDNCNYKSAIDSLTAYLKNSPQSAEAHYLLGQCLVNIQKFAEAKLDLKAAMKNGAGGKFTLLANQLMVKLPKNYSAPKQKYANAKVHGHKVAAAGIPRPQVIDFYADWDEPSKQLSTDLDAIKEQYGEQVEILRVNIDDPQNQAIVDQYEVSPVPTVVFLNTDGKINNYFVGYSGKTELDDGVKKVLNKS